MVTKLAMKIVTSAQQCGALSSQKAQTPKKAATDYVFGLLETALIDVNHQ
jgi:hypothetical protein